MDYLNKYHEYISQNNSWNENVHKYLVGHNKNLYGSIIGFKRGWRKNTPGD